MSERISLKFTFFKVVALLKKNYKNEINRGVQVAALFLSTGSGCNGVSLS